MTSEQSKQGNTWRSRGGSGRKIGAAVRRNSSGRRNGGDDAEAGAGDGSKRNIANNDDRPGTSNDNAQRRGPKSGTPDNDAFRNPNYDRETRAGARLDGVSPSEKSPSSLPRSRQRAGRWRQGQRGKVGKAEGEGNSPEDTARNEHQCHEKALRKSGGGRNEVGRPPLGLNAKDDGEGGRENKMADRQWWQKNQRQKQWKRQQQRQRQKPCISDEGTDKRSNKKNNDVDNRSRKSRTKVQYDPHAAHAACLSRYVSEDPTIVRGRLRVMPSRNGAAFVTCDRGSLPGDVLIKDEKDRNRGLDGDVVFVELLPCLSGNGDDCGEGLDNECAGKEITIANSMKKLGLSAGSDGDGDFEKKSEKNRPSIEGDQEGLGIEDEVESEEEDYLIEEEGYEAVDDGDAGGVEMWYDDDMQMSLWDPAVNLRKSSRKCTLDAGNKTLVNLQRNGKVICILPPKLSVGQQPSELNPSDKQYCNKQQIHKRTVVGTLTQLPDQNDGRPGRYLLVPNNRSLPRFMCPPGTKMEVSNDVNDENTAPNTLYQAEYAYNSWHATNRWPPCANVTRLCGTCTIADETKALLVENRVNHGEFPPAALRDVELSVKSGKFFNKGEVGWRPMETMYRGRQDYRNRRIFTIDPTTAKDLDDALHITPLPDGRVEIGVHIADVSHFVRPNSAVDEEALRRATTVYLVNAVIPMLPRPLCEVACSLNENVERLAFSCVWRMNRDGTLSKRRKGGGSKGNRGDNDVWYGRTVIKSCARLDYATAQNIIDGNVANGESVVDESLWPKSRWPLGGHTINEVAADVRLMHKVAMSRRRLRFENGALSLNSIKLTFQLEEDGQTPKLCAPYPIRDSNRLVEEFMLLANYLVAQRLITHAHGRALLRNHAPPIEQGMQQVVNVSKESFNFDIDTTSSIALQKSLSRLSRECDDELVVQCVTESLMTPMRPAEYVAAGELDEADWQHFALNIPYYTHFTSPIRRYPDVIVHRLLQATLDNDVDEFPLGQKQVHSAADHCNTMRMSAKKAQERSDRVFLSLYLKRNPISSALGVCLGVGEKTFTVFVPSIGLSTRVFLQEHEDEFHIHSFEEHGKRRILISPKTDLSPGMQPMGENNGLDHRSWKSLDVLVFEKLEVACTCKTGPPIDVQVKVVGPWTE